MQVRSMVAGVCAAGVVVGAAVLSSSSEGAPEVQIDYRDIAAQLVQRGSLSTAGAVTFRQYKFLASAEDFDNLAALVLSSQTSPTMNVRSAVEGWLTAHMPATREAWVGGTSYRPEAWRTHRQRMPEMDTALAAMTAQAQAAGKEPAPIVTEVVTHVAGEVLTIIEDNKAVFRSERTGHRHPGVPMDISLATWQDAIDLGANVEGQEIHASIDGPEQSIIYINNHADGTFGAAEYVFRPDLDWAPAEVRSFDEEGTDARFVYGYDLASNAPVARPAVVAQGQLVPTGEIDVVIWIIESWQDGCSPSAVGLRLPPVHLEIDYLVSPETPLVSMVEPTYLEGVTSCQKAAVAITNVAISIGTDAEDKDYDLDGYVTLGDIDSAQDTFNGAAQGP